LQLEKKGKVTGAGKGALREKDYDRIRTLQEKRDKEGLSSKGSAGHECAEKISQLGESLYMLEEWQPMDRGAINGDTNASG